MENANPVSKLPASASGDTRPRPESVSPRKRGAIGAKAAKKVAHVKCVKRRTKTGCLTCRQRRIKCGEEKPICKNCTKSKRECKGYAPRLIFKDPLGVTTDPAYTTGQTQPQQGPSGYEGLIDFLQTSAGTHGPILAPKRPAVSGLRQNSVSQTSHQFSRECHDANRASTDQFNVPAQTSLSWVPEQPLPSKHSSDSLQHRRNLSSIPWNDNARQSVDERHFTRDNNDGTWASQVTSSGTAYSSRVSQDSYTFDPAPARPARTPPSHKPEQNQTGHMHGQSILPKPVSPDFGYTDEDDDWHDVGSDEEAEEQVSMQNFNQLSLIMASANRDERQMRVFTTYLNEPNILASYQPTYGSSPLNNPKTARIFLHFIHATGPTMSVFERHPIDPSTMLGAPVPMAQQGLWTYTLPLKAFEHHALQQAILALSSLHIAYLQGGTATVSLKHYHYALKSVGKAVGLPLRRKQLGTLAATLLLAYYEVMTADHVNWNSHLAGSAQLIREVDFAGITRDLRAQRRNRWFEQQHGGATSFADSYLFGNSPSNDDPFAEVESSIDENVVGYMVGRAVNYDDFGQVEGDHTGSRKKHLSRKDIETFRIQCDLYWWYCKQEWIQSIISGGPLFMPYSQWGQCPPRAGLGRLDAIYGSFDHLSLLMGRLADFGNRDRKRKLRAAKAAGTEWKPDSKFMQFMARFARPRPGNQGQAPSNGPFGSRPGAAGPSLRGGFGPQSNVDYRRDSHGGEKAQQPRSGSSGSSPGSLPMYGMVPSAGHKRLPTAFTTTGGDSRGSDMNERDKDTASYEDAENEWESILAAFELFGRSLGPDFMPLPPDSTFPISSPFGPAIQYRTHNIGVIWGFYYTGRILLHRLHPSMPPAMMVAAGAAAPTTAEFANIIGKICAGVYGPQSFHHGVEGFSPTLGSCLIEITVPIFFAGVQYTDPVQRAWCIAVLNEISRLTGWKSSDSIARGCERAWRTAAAQGRGPPYQPAGETSTQQPKSWSSYAAAEGDAHALNANSERRFVKLGETQLTWAIGVLSLDDHLH